MMKYIKEFIVFWLDILVPRFITEKVALIETELGYEIICALDDVREGEHYDAVVTMQSFNLFGRGLFPKQIGEIEKK